MNTPARSQQVLYQSDASNLTSLPVGQISFRNNAITS